MGNKQEKKSPEKENFCRNLFKLPAR